MFNRKLEERVCELEMKNEQLLATLYGIVTGMRGFPHMLEDEIVTTVDTVLGTFEPTSLRRDVMNRIRLVEDFLGLEYKREENKKEPAKLVKKKVAANVTDNCDCGVFIDGVSITGGACSRCACGETSKKKRKYTKKRGPGRPKKK